MAKAIAKSLPVILEDSDTRGIRAQRTIKAHVAPQKVEKAPVRERRSAMMPTPLSYTELT
jgi:hypothetical protein